MKSWKHSKSNPRNPKSTQLSLDDARETKSLMKRLRISSLLKWLN